MTYHPAYMKSRVLQTLSAIALCFCLSFAFLGEAEAQSQTVGVTVEGFTTLDEVDNPTSPSFTAGETEFLNANSPTDISATDWGTVTINNANSGNNILLRGQSNVGGFYVDANVTEGASGTGGLESLELSLDTPNSEEVQGTNVTVKATQTENLAERTTPGALVFGIEYTTIKFDGNAVGTNNLDVDVTYTVTQGSI